MLQSAICPMRFIAFLGSYCKYAVGPYPNRRKGGRCNEKNALRCARRRAVVRPCARADGDRFAGGHAARALVPAAGGKPDEALGDAVGPESREGLQRAY